MEEELQGMKKTWGKKEKMAKDRTKWKTFVAVIPDNGIISSNKVYK